MNNRQIKYPDGLVKMINQSIEDYLSDYDEIPEVLRQSLRYSLTGPGKRFRPILCLLTAKSLGTEYDYVIPSACAIEFIHTYLLIHDDLPSMDNDDLRRGKPTCHKVFGEDIALLTGDALFSEAFRLIIEHQSGKPEIKIRVLKEIAEASGALGMVAGQVVDAYYAGSTISKKDLETMHANKTAKLIVASVKTGAILAEASKRNLDLFTGFAENIGLVFQITDDILELESTDFEAGKTLGKDLDQKKNTYPYIWGLDKSKKIARQKIDESIETLRNMKIESKDLIEISRFLIDRKK